MKKILNKLEDRLKIEPELKVGLFIQCDDDKDLFEADGQRYSRAEIEQLGNDENIFVMGKYETTFKQN